MTFQLCYLTAHRCFHLWSLHLILLSISFLDWILGFCCKSFSSHVLIHCYLLTIYYASLQSTKLFLRGQHCTTIQDGWHLREVNLGPVMTVMHLAKSFPTTDTVPQRINSFLLFGTSLSSLCWLCFLSESSSSSLSHMRTGIWSFFPSLSCSMSQ